MIQKIASKAERKMLRKMLDASTLFIRSVMIKLRESFRRCVKFIEEGEEAKSHETRMQNT